MNALKLAERLAKEEKELADLKAKRERLLKDSQTTRYSEWVAEHAAVEADSVKKEIDDKELLIIGIKAKLKETHVK